MTFRQLNSEDLFPLTTIIVKLGLNEFKTVFSDPSVFSMFEKDGKGNTGNTAKAVSLSLDIVGVILTNLPKAEKEIYSFMASVSGQSEEQLRKMKASEFIGAVADFIHSEDTRDFGRALGKLL